MHEHMNTNLGGVHKLSWHDFGFFRPTILPMFTFSMVWTLTKSGHFWTTYLPRLVKVVCEQPLRQIFNPIYCPEEHFWFLSIWINSCLTQWINHEFLLLLGKSTKLNIIKYCQIKGWWKSVDTFKVIYTKYSKHWPYTVAHTIDCVCRKC